MRAPNLSRQTAVGVLLLLRNLAVEIRSDHFGRQSIILSRSGLKELKERRALSGRKARSVGELTIPNYIESFLAVNESTPEPSRHDPSLRTFQELWSKTLGTQTPKPVAMSVRQ